MRIRSFAAYIFSATALAIAIPSLTAADLTVSKVVLYKHGIGFFERSGSVPAGDTAQLQFKATEMDDVLKSLTVEKRGGGGVSVRVSDGGGVASPPTRFPLRQGPRAPSPESGEGADDLSSKALADGGEARLARRPALHRTRDQNSISAQRRDAP